MNHLDENWLDKIKVAVAKEYFQIAEEENGETPESRCLIYWARIKSSNDEIQKFVTEISSLVASEPSIDRAFKNDETPSVDSVNLAVRSVIKMVSAPGRGRKRA